MLKYSKAYYLIGLFFLTINLVLGQDQQLADSLILKYESGTFKDKELELLKLISEEETDPNRALFYSELLIKRAFKDSLFELIQNGYLQKGNALRAMGSSSLALESYLNSIKYAQRTNDETGIGIVFISIATNFSEMGDFKNAKTYYNKGIPILRQSNDSIQFANALLNAGDLYFNVGVLDSSLIFTTEADAIYKSLNFSLGMAYSSGNLGMVYAEQGNDEIAEKNINEAIIILEGLEDYYPISVYLTYMSDIYLRKNDWTAAQSYAERSLELSKKYGLKEQISDANLKLSQLHDQKGEQTTSYKYYKDHILYRDSVNSIETVQKMANQRANYEISQKQTEVDLLNEQKRNQQLVSIASGVGIVLILTLTIGLYRRNNFITKSKLLIEYEKKRSDKLLLNILPEETAKELKDNGKVKAKKFESVSVLFTDFEGFTKYSANLSPEELVESVNYYYSKFDEIIDKYGLEKIKTVGDAYMAAGGLPFPSDDHALRLVKAGYEMADFVKEAKKFDPDNMTRFDIRIGINTGPVVAGVVGTKKFAYDIWGDTVNIASRMESNSEPGKINISDNTYQLIKEDFDCIYRGEIEAKNKGKMKMYFVDAIKVKTI